MKRWSKRGLSLMVSALVLLALMPAALVGAEPGYEGEPPAPPTAESRSDTEAAPPASSGPQAEQEPSSEGAAPSDAARFPSGTIEPDGEPGQEPGAEGENGPEDEDTDLGPTWPEEEEPNEDTAPARRATGAPLVQGAGGVLPAAATVTVTGTAVTLDGLVAGDLASEIQTIVDDGTYTDITVPEDIEKLTVSGDMNEADMTYIWKGSVGISGGNLPNLQVMDLAGVVYESNALQSDQFALHTALEEVWLPGNLTSTGAFAFNRCTSLKSIDLPDGINFIGSEAFYGCTNLTSIDLPDGINFIGNEAFYGCTNLTSIDLPDGINYIDRGAFSGCTSLTSIDLPDGIISIEPRAFADCTSLTSIDLPDGLISIGSNAFDGCTSLTSIDLSGCANLASIDSLAFARCTSLATAYLPSGGSSIVALNNSNAFQGCNNTRVVVPASLLDEYKADTVWGGAVTAGYIQLVTIIPGTAVTLDGLVAGELASEIQAIVDNGTYTDITDPADITKLTVSGAMNEADMTYIWKGSASTGDGNLPKLQVMDLAGVVYEGNALQVEQFARHPALVEVGLPGNLTSTGDYAFYLCENLTSIDLPDGLISIGGRAFMGCKNLTSIYLPDGLISIGDYAFHSCKNLKSIDLSGCVNLASIGQDAFGSCTDLATVYLPDGITSIGYNAFIECTSLTSIDLSGCVNLDYIDDFAFFSCMNLTSIDLSECVNLASIGNYAFSSCTSLTSIDLSGCVNLASIGKEAFYRCENLTSIDLSGCVSLTSIGQNAFENSTNLTSIDLSGCVSLASIGSNAFFKCTSLATVYLPSGGSSIVTLKDSNAFQYCNNTRVVVPASLLDEYKADTVWGGAVTAGYIQLVTIIPGTEVTLDGLVAGELEDEIDAIVLDDLYIDINAPEDITALTVSGDMNEADMTYIWKGSVGISGGNLPKLQVMDLAEVDYDSNALQLYQFAYHPALEEVWLPGNLTSIGHNAFSGCPSLASIDLPDGLISIGDSAFEDCTSLKSIDLSGCVNLNSIKDGAFSSCTSLTSIDLSGCTDLNSISEGAFWGCTSLRRLYMPENGTNIVPIGNSNVFNGCPQTIVVVPDTLLNDYKTAGNWQDAETDNKILLVGYGTSTNTLTYSATSGGQIIPNGPYTSGCDVYAGQKIVFLATANPGYRFTSWTATGATPATSTFANQTFTITGDANITARFEQITYSVTVNTPAEGGSVAADKSEAAEGAAVTLTLSPASSYRFKEWNTTPASLADEITGSGNTYTFTMPAEAVTIEPVFEQITHAIGVTANPAAGGTVSGGGNVAENTSHTVTATPNIGYSFVNWTEGGQEVSTNPSYTFTVTGPRTLVANFKADPVEYAISVSASPAAGGTVSGGGNVAENTSHTVTATPNTGYSFVNWTEGGQEVSTNPSYTFTVTGPHTLVANFKADKDTNDGGSSSSSSKPDTSNPAALAFASLPENNTVRVGDRFTLTPTEDGQKGSTGWAWDSDFFSATFNSPATFTALKAGSSTITYTAPDGRTASVTITIQAASSTSSSTAITQTGDNSLVWLYATMALLAAAAVGGLAILKKRRAKQ